MTNINIPHKKRINKLLQLDRHMISMAGWEEMGRIKYMHTTTPLHKVENSFKT